MLFKCACNWITDVKPLAQMWLKMQKMRITNSLLISLQFKPRATCLFWICLKSKVFPHTDWRTERQTQWTEEGCTAQRHTLWFFASYLKNLQPKRGLKPKPDNKFNNKSPQITSLFVTRHRLSSRADHLDTNNAMSNTESSSLGWGRNIQGIPPNQKCKPNKWFLSILDFGTWKRNYNTFFRAPPFLWGVVAKRNLDFGDAVASIKIPSQKYLTSPDIKKKINKQTNR